MARQIIRGGIFLKSKPKFEKHYALQIRDFIVTEILGNVDNLVEVITNVFEGLGFGDTKILNVIKSGFWEFGDKVARILEKWDPKNSRVFNFFILLGAMYGFGIRLILVFSKIYTILLKNASGEIKAAFSILKNIIKQAFSPEVSVSTNKMTDKAIIVITNNAVVKKMSMSFRGVVRIAAAIVLFFIKLVTIGIDSILSSVKEIAYEVKLVVARALDLVKLIWAYIRGAGA